MPETGGITYIELDEMITKDAPEFNSQLLSLRRTNRQVSIHVAKGSWLQVLNDQKDHLSGKNRLAFLSIQTV